ncbi:MAG: DEAD/DEAH box helicase [Pseudomonadota bacterium]|nr:DEAD/DEAH box helicase [Pseudomonadota bacterium]MEE3322170.1 DEAD/DEAH box helicase [Pseudomonadota bacterium]
MTELTLKRLRNTEFPKLYSRLVFGEGLSDIDKIKILSVAVVLVNCDDVDLANLGYRIALFYGNETGDYRPLYDVAINKGLIPVASFAKSYMDDVDGFISNFVDAYIEMYRDGEKLLTEQQKKLIGFFGDNKNNSISVVAPTSYGKSDLIGDFLNDVGECRAVIIVPSKSLVVQTKKRVIEAQIPWVKKVITHPDMTNDSEEGCVFVVTQERLSKSLHDDKNLIFDTAIIDEAHNLLGGDERSALLAIVICILYSRNNDVAFKFLTPFLVDSNSLRLRYINYEFHNYSVSEYVKSERLYLSDFRRKKNDHRLYDQFLNCYFPYSCDSSNYIDLIKDNSLSKNIVYFNKPKDIEAFCLDFIRGMDDVHCDLIDSACGEMLAFTSEHYRLVECMRKGVVYHHGSVPEIIKIYVEELFRKSKSLRYLVTSSTLLEGVNLPAERLFMLDNKKGRRLLSPSQMKNLAGRVGRFKEVFSEVGNLQLLEPSIYLIGTDRYTGKGDLQGFINRSFNVSRNAKDEIENVLLEKTEIDENSVDLLKSSERRMENLEPGIVYGYEGGYAKTEVGALLFSNNVIEIDIFNCENEIQDRINELKSSNRVLGDPGEVVEFVSSCFLCFSDDPSLSRLCEEPAIRFYSMFLDWMVNNLPFKQMVARMVGYWDELDADSQVLVYVGKWGDVKLEGSHYTHWTDVREKSRSQKANLAIVRIKEEEDFFDYKILRFIDVLFDIGVVDKDFYKLLKYGTSDERRIALIKEGFGRSLSELLVRKYSDFLNFSESEGVAVSGAVLTRMRNNNESQILQFEASLNIKD